MSKLTNNNDYRKSCYKILTKIFMNDEECLSILEEYIEFIFDDFKFEKCLKLISKLETVSIKCYNNNICSKLSNLHRIKSKIYLIFEDLGNARRNIAVAREYEYSVKNERIALQIELFDSNSDIDDIKIMIHSISDKLPIEESSLIDGFYYIKQLKFEKAIEKLLSIIKNLTSCYDKCLCFYKLQQCNMKLGEITKISRGFKQKHIIMPGFGHISLNYAEIYFLIDENNLGNNIINELERTLQPPSVVNRCNFLRRLISSQCSKEEFDNYSDKTMTLEFLYYKNLLINSLTEYNYENVKIYADKVLTMWNMFFDKEISRNFGIKNELPYIIIQCNNFKKVFSSNISFEMKFSSIFGVFCGKIEENILIYYVHKNQVILDDSKNKYVFSKTKVSFSDFKIFSVSDLYLIILNRNEILKLDSDIVIATKAT